MVCQYANDDLFDRVYATQRHLFHRSDLLSFAALGGRMHALLVLESQTLPSTLTFSTDVLDKAAASGNMDMIRYLVEHRTEGCSGAMFGNALESQCPDKSYILRYLYTNFYGMSVTGKSSFYHLLFHGDLAIVKLVVGVERQGERFDGVVFVMNQFVDYLRDLFMHVTFASLRPSSAYQHLEIIRYVSESFLNRPLSSIESVSSAIDHPDTLDKWYLVLCELVVETGLLPNILLRPVTGSIARVLLGYNPYNFVIQWMIKHLHSRYARPFDLICEFGTLSQVQFAHGLVPPPLATTVYYPSGSDPNIYRFLLTNRQSEYIWDCIDDPYLPDDLFQVFKEFFLGIEQPPTPAVPKKLDIQAVIESALLQKECEILAYLDTVEFPDDITYAQALVSIISSNGSLNFLPDISCLPLKSSLEIDILEVYLSLISQVHLQQSLIRALMNKQVGLAKVLYKHIKGTYHKPLISDIHDIQRLIYIQYLPSLEFLDTIGLLPLHHLQSRLIYEIPSIYHVNDALLSFLLSKGMPLYPTVYYHPHVNYRKIGKEIIDLEKRTNVIKRVLRSKYLFRNIVRPENGTQTLRYKDISYVSWILERKYFSLLLYKIQRGDKLIFSPESIELVCKHVTDQSLFSMIYTMQQYRFTSGVLLATCFQSDNMAGISLLYSQTSPIVLHTPEHTDYSISALNFISNHQRFPPSLFNSHLHTANEFYISRDPSITINANLTKIADSNPHYFTSCLARFSIHSAFNKQFIQLYRKHATISANMSDSLTLAPDNIATYLGPNKYTNFESIVFYHLHSNLVKSSRNPQNVDHNDSWSSASRYGDPISDEELDSCRYGRWDEIKGYIDQPRLKLLEMTDAKTIWYMVGMRGDNHMFELFYTDQFIIDCAVKGALVAGQTDFIDTLININEPPTKSIELLISSGTSDPDSYRYWLRLIGPLKRGQRAKLWIHLATSNQLVELCQFATNRPDLSQLLSKTEISIYTWQHIFTKYPVWQQEINELTKYYLSPDSTPLHGILSIEEYDFYNSISKGQCQAIRRDDDPLEYTYYNQIKDYFQQFHNATDQEL
eukprot:gene16742-19902_t